jgi:hypothetical protein
MVSPRAPSADYTILRRTAQYDMILWLGWQILTGKGKSKATSG